MAAKKTTEETTVKKTAEKTATVKKTAAKAAETKPAKAEKTLKTKIAVQFGGKGYDTDEFVKMARDVWAFDLKREAADLTQLDLYVKPEESKVYCVFNGTELGSFNI